MKPLQEPFRVFIYDKPEIVEAIRKALDNLLSEMLKVYEDLKGFSTTNCTWQIDSTQTLHEAEEMLKTTEYDITIFNGGDLPEKNTTRLQVLLLVPQKNNKVLKYIYTGLMSSEELNIALKFQLEGYYDKNETTPTKLVEIIMKDFEFRNYIRTKFKGLHVEISALQKSLKAYPNNWVAILNGKIIDHDLYKTRLVKRFMKDFKAFKWPSFIFITPEGEIRYA